MRLSAHNIFLFDGAGAVGSAVALGLILPRFPAHIGLPVGAYYALSLIAVLFGGFSFSRHFFATPPSRPSNLQLLAGLNLCYCLLTIGLLVQHVGRLRVLEWLYFAGEVVVIVVLARVEWGIARGLRTAMARTGDGL